jgi:methylated-DNA-[protein]-cysteine S-methyltransferase
VSRLFVSHFVTTSAVEDAVPDAHALLVTWAAFDTAIGRCAVAWGDAGIVGAQLPEVDASALRARMQQRFPGSAQGQPDAAVAAVIAAVQAMLRGEPADVSHAKIDWRGVPEFQRRVFEAALAIAPGCTLTYGEIAKRLGQPGAARAVGQALGKNPFAPIVPCHRVLAAGGRIGGFSAPGGATTKRRMLAIEGARIGAEPALF